MPPSLWRSSAAASPQQGAISKVLSLSSSPNAGTPSAARVDSPGSGSSSPERSGKKRSGKFPVPSPAQVSAWDVPWESAHELSAAQKVRKRRSVLRFLSKARKDSATGVAASSQAIYSPSSAGLAVAVSSPSAAPTPRSTTPPSRARVRMVRSPGEGYANAREVLAAEIAAFAAELRVHAAQAAEDRRRLHADTRYDVPPPWAELSRLVGAVVAVEDGDDEDGALRTGAALPPMLESPVSTSPRLESPASTAWLTDDVLQKTAHAARDILYEERAATLNLEGAGPLHALTAAAALAASAARADTWSSASPSPSASLLVAPPLRLVASDLASSDFAARARGLSSKHTVEADW